MSATILPFPDRKKAVALDRLVATVAFVLVAVTIVTSFFEEG